MSTSAPGAFAFGVLLCTCNGAWAQSTNSDWSGNAQFRTTYDQSVIVSLADMQKRADSGYYNAYSLSQTYNTTNNVLYQNSGNSLSTGTYNAANTVQYQNSGNSFSSTTVGSQNNTYASNNSNTSINTGAVNTGCSNASVTLSGGPAIAPACGGH